MPKEDNNRYYISGMSCAACQAHVEKAVGSLPGIRSCSVSLLTNSMIVDGDADPSDIIRAVEKAGYGAKLASSEKDKLSGSGKASAADELKDTESPRLIRRLISSAAMLLILMYFSMGVMMLGWPSPVGMSHQVTAYIEAVLSGIILIINRRFFVSGVRSLMHKAPNMDTLVSMGSGVSYIYSLVTLFRMHGADEETAMRLMDSELYFESAAMIVTLITVGKLLESISKGRTTDALKSLIKLAPDTAVVIRDGEETQIPASEVKVGDVFVVRAGSAIPVDGVVISGNAAVNESALTGESVPVDKNPGDKVSAACISTTGFLKCRAERVGEDTTLSQIIGMVRDASSTKAPIAKIADKVSGIFVPSVITIAFIVFFIWILTGSPVPYAFTRAVAVLVVSCPCALGLATPVAIMVSSGVGARCGILFKTSEAIEETGRSVTAVLDKTGTLTKGEPVVTDVIPCSGTSENELLRMAASLEKKSEHPLGRAVTVYAEKMNAALEEAEDFSTFPGNGLKGVIGGAVVQGGKAAFIEEKSVIPEDMKERAGKLSGEGKTPLFFSADGRLLGIIAVSDVLKEDSKEAVSELKKLGLKVIMVTGDNEITASALASESGIDEVRSGVLPGGKGDIINSLKSSGKVLMIGDGINDAPALTAADTGMAIGTGTDVAIDSADVVLMRSSLMDACSAIRLSKKTLAVIHENLFWAFIYNILLIPIAAGALSGFGIEMSPMLGAAAMSISSFTVCMNALRLNLFKPYKTGYEGRLYSDDKTEGNSCDACLTAKNETLKQYDNYSDLIKEDAMTKTMTIEGMMCGHCEATVKKALEAIDGVASADVSHEKGTAVVSLASDVPDDVLKKAVEDRDYKVLSIV